jgi:hypothetical protein
MFLIYLSLPTVTTFLMYGPIWLVGAYSLTFLPLVIQIIRKETQPTPQARRSIHSWAVLLPLGPFLFFPFHTVGEAVATWFPGCCTISMWKEIQTNMRDKSGEPISFSLGGGGWGNPRSFEFTNASAMLLTRNRRFDDLSYVYLPELRGHYTNSHTTDFRITREKLLEFVEKSGDFPNGDAERIADKLWEGLHDFIERRNLPPLEYYRFGAEPVQPFTYSVTDSSICLMTIFISSPCLFVVSLLLVYMMGTCEPKTQV